MLEQNIVEITQALPKQASEIQQFLKIVWKETYGDHLSESTLNHVYKNYQTQEFLLKQIQNTEMYFPLVTKRQKVIALATAYISGETIALFRLFVDHRYQRKGIATLLLTDVIHHFSNAAKIQLYVETLNQHARNFYNKRGFIEMKKELEKIGNQVVEQILLEKIL